MDMKLPRSTEEKQDVQFRHEIFEEEIEIQS
jgi:hypothetical protein